MILRLNFCILVLQICFLTAFSQENLIPNHNFDTELSCTSGPSTISDWFIPNPKEINLNNLCPYIDWWRFIRDPKQGYNGSQCGYVETYYKGFADDNIYSGRIYLAVKLIKPLTAGKEYYFEMKVKAVDTFPNRKLVNTIFTNSQDVAFVKDQPTFDYDIPRNFIQLRPTVTSRLITDYTWHTISGCFTAGGHENYMIIGNFKNDANTDIFTTGKRNPNFPNGLIANYAIDDVVLTETHIDLKDTAVCENEKLEINITKSLPAGLSIRWDNGSTDKNWTSDKSGTHAVILHYGSACTHTETFDLRIIPNNYKPSTIEQVLCKGKEITLSASLGAPNEKVKWNTGATAKSITIHRSGIYSATLENKCTFYKQDFKVKEEICEDGIYIPNIFIADDVHEFKPQFQINYPEINNFKMYIYDRWGNIVFTSKDKEIGWKGLSGNTAVIQGVYLYQISYEVIINNIRQRILNKGDLTLIH